MKNLTMLTLISAIFVILATSHGHAQNHSAAYMLFSNSAEAAGYGEAYSTLGADASAAFWNPAGLTRIENFSFSANSAVGLMYDRQFNAASAAVSIPGMGTIGVSATHSGVSNIMGYSSTGEQTGEFGVTNLVFGASYAVKVTENVSFGVTGRFINQDLHVQVDNGYGADVGIRYDHERFSIGTALQSVAGEVGPDELPTILRAGVSVYPFEGLRLAADIIMDDIEDSNARRYANLGLGYQIGVNDAFITPRVGINDGKVAMGAGIGYGTDFLGVRIDYAYVNEPGDLFGMSHRVGLVIY